MVEDTKIDANPILAREQMRYSLEHKARSDLEMAPIVPVVEEPLPEESGEVFELAGEAVPLVKEGLMVVVRHAAVPGVPRDVDN